MPEIEKEFGSELKDDDIAVRRYFVYMYSEMYCAVLWNGVILKIPRF